MQCPGQDSRYWKPGAIFETECPQCGQKVEFFKDDTARKCPACGHRFVNPAMDFGCAAYCQFAEQCLGSLPPEVVAQQEELLKDKVAMQMRRHFGSDHARITHANRVAKYAEKLSKQERADPAVVLIAAYLHDMDNPTAGEASPSESRRQWEAQRARSLLEGLGAKQELIDEVIGIITSHQLSEGEGSLNFQVLSDAHALVDLEDRLRASRLHPQDLEELLDRELLTPSGRELARQTLWPAESSR